MKGRWPVWRGNAAVTVSVEQRAKGQRVRKQEQPHANFLGVGSEQRRFVNRRQVVRKGRVSHASSLLVTRDRQRLRRGQRSFSVRMPAKSQCRPTNRP